MRRVGDADVNECEHALLHPGDRYVTVSFVADLWARCFFAYCADGRDWVPAPGMEMALKEEKSGRKFEITIEASRCVFAFNNGGEGEEQFWDSNNGANVRVHARS